jgi:phosphotransferase system HPr-like phosphotransfer protein
MSNPGYNFNIFNLIHTRYGSEVMKLARNLEKKSINIVKQKKPPHARSIMNLEEQRYYRRASVSILPSTAMKAVRSPLRPVGVL